MLEEGAIGTDRRRGAERLRSPNVESKQPLHEGDQGILRKKVDKKEMTGNVRKKHNNKARSARRRRRNRR